MSELDAIKLLKIYSESDDNDYDDYNFITVLKKN